MKLFFETGEQAWFFLMMIPLGFVIALCLHTGPGTGMLRLVQDMLILLCGGVAAALMLLSARDESLRLYHLLGIVCGALLYMCGLGRGVRWLKIRRRGRNQNADEELLQHQRGKDDA